MPTSAYHAMYGGLDYHLNHEFDLYFNLIYAMLDRALAKRVSTIEVGLGGDAFKAKIGCYCEPLYVFAKGRRTADVAYCSRRRAPSDRAQARRGPIPHLQELKSSSIRARSGQRALLDRLGRPDSRSWQPEPALI